MFNESICLTREELYERVWKTPAVSLARELGISDVALGKICKKLDVPKPYPGYWQQLKVGRRVHRPPLPPVKKGVPAATYIAPHPEGRTFKPQDPRTLELIGSESEPQKLIVVAENLHHSHPFVRQTREILERAPKDCQARLAHWARPHLNVRVSKQRLHRALRILDALIKALEARGFSVELPKEGATPTRVVIGEEKVSFYLWEKDNRSEHVYTKEELSKPSYQRPDRWIFTLSGKLTFTIDEHWDDYSKKNWKDKEGRPLEDQLNDVVVGLVTAAEALWRKRLEREEQERRRKEEATRRQEEERRRLEEEARRSTLEKQSERWTKCQNLRAFLIACQAELIMRSGHLKLDGPEASWLRWAGNHADRLDPLKNGYLDEAVGVKMSSADGGS
jgi:hypothetical protein